MGGLGNYIIICFKREFSRLGNDTMVPNDQLINDRWWCKSTAIISLKIIVILVITFVDKPFDVHEHIWKRGDLFAVFEQLRQIVGNALRVDRVHFRHFHGNFVV